MARSQEDAPAPRLPIVVVSGLPRAGTSLLMQMLAAGGFPVLADGARPPDASNPRGYYEWAPARRLAREPEAIRAARGRAVKVISALLGALPEDERYLVLFAERDPEEIELSQRRMLARLALARGEPAPADDGVDAAALAAHVAGVRAWLDAEAQRQRFSVLEVRHESVMTAPNAAAARIASFLVPVCAAIGVSLDLTAMAAAVEPRLHRARIRAPRRDAAAPSTPPARRAPPPRRP